MSRTDDRDQPGVEFLVGPLAAGADEDLLQPGDVGAPARSRLRVPLAWLAAFALLAALIVRGVATHQPKPTADESGSSAPSSAPTFSTTAPVVIRDEPARGPADCPRAGDGQSMCISRHTVSAAVVAAVRRAFPGARLGRVLDEQLRDIGFGSGGLWYRSVTASLGTTTIVVVVRVVRGSDIARRSLEPEGNDGRTTISVQRLTRAFAVSVSVTASTAHLPSFATLAALAGDTRLAA